MYGEGNIYMKRILLFSHRNQTYSKTNYILATRTIYDGILLADIGNICYSDHAFIYNEETKKLATK